MIIFAIPKQPLIRPGGFPERDMRFKIDDNFKKVAGAMVVTRTIEEDAKGLAQAFIDNGVIQDNPFASYGEPLYEAEKGKLVDEVFRVAADYMGVRSMDAEVFDALANSVLMGDGDCPVCGGTMAFRENLEERQYYYGPDGHLEEGSYEDNGTLYICPLCGHEYIEK